GTGLGLYLVKLLIERYDGYVEVKDSELGGARFDIHLKK
ncbi:MAG: ATP-binding protein, partial [Candidatus Saliniplasma sp.]